MLQLTIEVLCSGLDASMLRLAPESSIVSLPDSRNRSDEIDTRILDQHQNMGPD